jgi:secreted trypsin-like serine protease
MFAWPAAAIIMRHDVPDARYRELGETQRGVVVQLGLLAEEDGAPMLYSGMGALIGPDWVLTAAHAAAHMRTHQPANGGTQYVYYRGRGYAVAEIIIHPDYDEQTYANDIALVRLARSVRDPHPACLFETSDELGKIVTLAGSGYQGNGRDGPAAHPDGALRGARVRVGGAEGTELTWRFHAPRERGAQRMEGISGPGDSGGPALIETPLGLCVAGVSSAQRIVVPDDAPSGAEPPGEGHYGVVEVYTRVSRFIPWIRVAMTRERP